MFERLGVFVFAACLTVACGGSAVQEPLTPSWEEVAAHSITLIEPIHRSTADSFGESVAVELTVSETGIVIVAEPASYEGTPPPPTADVMAEAVANARVVTFEPFVRDGTARPARFTVHVPVQRPERPVTRRVPFPDLSGREVIIRLERTECYGTCPAYVVEISGDGQVTFTGRSYVAVPGVHRRRIPPEAVQRLLALFREADFFSLEDLYVGGVTDMPSQEVTLTIGERSKAVVDYAGAMEGMPFDVERLEHAIDREAGVRIWVDGDATTAAGLADEGYDFTAPAAGEALVWMAWDGSEDAAIDFVTRGAPLVATTEEEGFGRRRSALEGAAMNGRKRLLQTLIDAAAMETPGTAEVALVAAGGSRDVATLEVMLGAATFNRRQLGLALTATLNNPTYHDPELDPTPVVERLLALDADVTATNGDGQTPLHGASSPAMVRRLLSLGADIEARDKYNSTPVLCAYDQDVILALLDAGADPTVVPQYSQSLKKRAEENGWTRVLARLSD